MFLPLLVLYAVYVSITGKNTWIVLILTAAAFIAGFGLSAFFWLPAFYEGKYTLREIVTRGEALTRFVPVSWLFRSAWNYGGGNEFSKELGAVHWIGTAGAVWLLISGRLPRREKIAVGGLLVTISLSVFLMVPAATSVWQAIPFLQTIQFPWRFLSLSVLSGSLLAAYALARLTADILQRKTRILVRTAIMLFPLLLTLHMWQPESFIPIPDREVTGAYPGTTDTGESSPVWSVRFMEHYAPAPLEVVEGEASA